MKKIKKFFKISALSLTFLSPIIFAAPLLLSCSAQLNQLVYKELVLKKEQKNEFNKMQNIDVDIKRLLWGDPNFNNGNYIIIYGTTFPTDEGIKFLEWLSKDNISNSTNDGKKNPVKSSLTNPIINNTFFDEIFNLKNNIGYKNISSKAKIILFLDSPDITELENSENIYKGYDFYTSADPFAKYQEEQLIKKYNIEVLGFKPDDLNQGVIPTNGNYITSFIDLPENWKLKLNEYIRNDSKTAQYRENIEYMLKLRSNISSIITSDNKNSGIIAFSYTKNFNAPISPKISSDLDISSVIENIKNYYFPD